MIFCSHTRHVSPRSPLRRWKRWGWYWGLGAIATLVVLLSPFLLPPTQAQLPSLQPDSSQPPADVQRRGLLEITDVLLDGERVFRIAAPTVFDRSNPQDQIPVEIRARQINATLQQLTMVVPAENRSPYQDHTTFLDPETLRIVYQSVNGQPVLFVDDAYLATARVVLTVTAADVQYHSTTADALAERWQEQLEDHLLRALQNRQPEARQAQIRQALGLALGMIMLIGGLFAVRHLLGHRKSRLEEVQKEQIAGENSLEPLRNKNLEYHRSQFFETLKRHLGLQRRLQIVSFLRWLLLWIADFVALGGVAAILYTFPQTRSFSLALISIPALILTTWFVVGLLDRLLDFAIDRFLDIWETENEEIATPASIQRMFTITNAIKGVKSLAVYGLGILWVLQRLNLVPGSVLALGALAALALSFTAQSLVRDMINGFLILLEDHYGIGDYVGIGTVMGVVENLTLRMTQIRTDAGNLVTLPNGQIHQASNMSRTWSRSDFVVRVDYATDVNLALDTVRSEFHKMVQDPDWRAFVFEPPDLLGVDELSHEGIQIRIWMRTAPLKQWRVAQEFRRRLKMAFDAKGIQIGIPKHQFVGQLTDSQKPPALPAAASPAPPSSDSSPPTSPTDHTMMHIDE